MIRTQVQLTEGQMRDLRRMAEKEGVSVAEIVRRSVDRYIRTTQGLTDEERRQRALSFAGRFRDPARARDVAERHDDYLYGPDATS
jgi:16S rRNA U516 pseudouridylate synthase RsuA-like enzyme